MIAGVIAKTGSHHGLGFTLVSCRAQGANTLERRKLAQGADLRYRRVGTRCGIIGAKLFKTPAQHDISLCHLRHHIGRHPQIDDPGLQGLPLGKLGPEAIEHAACRPPRG